MGNTNSQDIKLSPAEYQQYQNFLKQQSTQSEQATQPKQSTQPSREKNISEFTQKDIDPYNILSKQQMPIEQLSKVYKKLLVKNHPDQGGNPEVFKEIMKAYKNINKYIEYQNNNKTHQELKQNYNVEIEHNQELQLQKPKEELDDLNKNFNRDKFNEMYEKFKFQDNSDEGYGHMIEKSNPNRDDIDIQNTIGTFNKQKFHTTFTTQKEKNNQVIEYTPPQALESLNMNFAMLGEEKIDDYSDRGNNSYTDYKKAYSDTILINPDSVSYTEYKNVKEIEAARQNLKLSDKERYIIEQKEKEEKENEWLRQNKLKEQDIKLNNYFENNNQKILEFYNRR